MIKSIGIALLFLFTVFTSQSQILNIEQHRLAKDTTKTFILKSTGGLNIFNRSAAESSPVNLFGYNFKVNSILYPKKHAYIFISQFDYLRINDNDFLNFGFAHFRTDFFRKRKVNPEVFAQYSFDNFRGLFPRWVFGASMRHKFINEPKARLIMGIGAFYEREVWQHPGEDFKISTNFVKPSTYLSTHITLNDYLSLNGVFYYQVGFDKSIGGLRNRTNGNIDINSKITDRLSFNNSFEFAFEDKPIVPITRFIFNIRTGFSLDF
jgi:hypothetical protein